MMLMRKVVLAVSKLCLSLLAFEFDVGVWIIAKGMSNGSRAGVMNS
jgi:hypothetical protein